MKIIGYKLVKHEYHVPAKRILNCLPKHDYIDLGTVTAKGDIELLQEAGVLDLWFEPIHETPQIPKGSDAERFVEMVGCKQRYTKHFECNIISFHFETLNHDIVKVYFNLDGTFSHIY
jgi:hypothetical protein